MSALPALLLLAVLLPLNHAATFFVSPTGSDSNTGLSPGAAFASLPRAQAATRASGEACSVFLLQGVHALNTTLALQAGADDNVLWSAFDGGATSATPSIVSGGVEVTGWRPATDAKALVAPIPSPAARVAFEQLFVGGRRVHPARLPPADASAYSRGLTDGDTLEWVKPLPDPTMGFVYNSSDLPASIRNVGNVSVMVFHAWTATRSAIGQLSASNASLVFAEPSRTAVGSFSASGKRYVLVNVFEALVAGTFYRDDAQGLLYYVPVSPAERSALQSGTMAAYVPVVPTLISVGASNVTMAGLTFRHAGVDAVDAVADSVNVAAVAVADGANGVNMSAVDVGLCAGNGISVESATNVLVGRSLVWSTGGNGIEMLSSHASNVTIVDNIVRDVAWRYLIQPALVHIRGNASIAAAQNDLSGSPYAGIRVGWQNGVPTPQPASDPVFTVAHNSVTDYGLGILSDFGGIYMSSENNLCFEVGTCSLPTRVEGNLIANGSHPATGYGSEGVYMDEQVASILITGNLIHDIGDGGIYFHCGTNNTATQNIVAYTGLESGLGSFKSCNSGGNPTWPNLTHGFTWTHNAVLVGADAHLTTDTDYRSTVFDYNLYWSADGATRAASLEFPNHTTWSQWRSTGQDPHSRVADPLFVDAVGRNFTFGAGSPAPALGIPQFNMGAVGPRESPFSP